MHKATTGVQEPAAFRGPSVDPSSNAFDTDVLGTLVDDHREIERLFDAIAADPPSSSMRAARVARLCALLSRHAAIEEELVYPFLRAAIRAPALVIEAEIEHEHVRALVGTLAALSPDDERFEPTLHVLDTYVQQHVAEEEEELFAAARASGVALAPLGEAVAARRRALLDAPPAAPHPGSPRAGAGAA